MEARTERQQRTTQWLFVGLLVLGLVVIGLAGAGYIDHWMWTGLVKRDKQGHWEPAKSLWDWLQLLIIPVVLAAGAAWFNLQQKQYEIEIADRNRATDLDIAKGRSQDAALENYLSKLSELLLEKRLRNPDQGIEVRNVAQAWTLTALAQLDGKRKGLLLQFLYESGLLGEEGKGEAHQRAIIPLKKADLRAARAMIDDLSGADLSGADLSEAAFDGVDLTGSHLIEATLRGAHLRAAFLSGATLWGANLGGADLSRANLSESDLRETDLGNANLTDTNLAQADLRMADLTGAIVMDDQLREANVAGATMPDGRKFQGWEGESYTRDNQSTS